MKIQREIVLMVLIFVPSSKVIASGEVSAIGLDNWLKHEKIVEIRKIFSEIQSSDWKESSKEFDLEPKECWSNRYPVKSIKIIQDPKGMVRKFSYSQIISHGKLLNLESYYDSQGVNRFVLQSLGEEVSRIYLDEGGKVFWSVTEEEGKVRPAEFEEDVDWALKFKTSDTAKMEYQSQNGC